MKLVSWNVNGLRAVLNKGFADFVNSVDADVICLQETKAMPEQVDAPCLEDGWHGYWNSAVKKGYSGTAVFSREEPLSCQNGFGIEEHDQEGRVISLEYPDFYLVNVYTPNAQNELKRLPYRQQWDAAFLDHLQNLEERKPVIFCGDLNVAHQEIDLARPKANRKNPGFSDEEREGFGRILDAGFIDTYRHFYPDRAEAYSWWSYRANARAKNIGWRIDYFGASQALESRLGEASILADVLGSDHCPVTLSLK